MSITIETQSSTKAVDYKRPSKSSANTRSIGYKAILAVILLICSFAVFLLGPNYSTLFLTNGKALYATGVSAVFLIAALLFKRSR